jgi:hypothetical protein
MRHDRIVTLTSLLTVLLVTLHVAGDIARGSDPGNLTSLVVLVPIVGVWLYATLLLPRRRVAYAILLLGSLLGLVIPIIHMKGAGIGGGGRSGEFLFVWVLLALGASSGFLFLLAVLGLWRPSRTEPGGPDRAA